jgi:uncharacterized protein (DUF58 family)
MTYLVIYLQAIFFSVMFLMFINGSVGWAMIYVLVGAGTASAVSCFLSRKHFSVEVKSLAGLTEFGGRMTFEVIVRKTGFCFIPHMEIYLDDSSDAVVRTSLLFRRQSVVRVGFKASRSGINTVTAQNAQIRDFWGLIKLDVPLGSRAYAAVTPKYVEYNGPEIFPSTLPSDDEDAEEGKTVISGGMPGYERREYVPGDSLRRIDYKLSAKKQKLMVRLDESGGCAAVNLLIADGGLSDCGDMAYALASKLVQSGGRVKIIHKGQSISAGTPETLMKMREWLAFRMYGESEENADNAEKETENKADEEINVIFSGKGEIEVCGR